MDLYQYYCSVSNREKSCVIVYVTHGIVHQNYLHNHHLHHIASVCGYIDRYHIETPPLYSYVQLQHNIQTQMKCEIKYTQNEDIAHIFIFNFNLSLREYTSISEKLQYKLIIDMYMYLRIHQKCQKTFNLYSTKLMPKWS